MPPETQTPSTSISPTLGKPKRNWKKIFLILLILGISVSLVGVGVWLLISKPVEPPSKKLEKQTTSPTQKQVASKKGVLYLKPSGQKATLPIASLLGDLWIYDLGNKKETQITKDGRVANNPMVLSPNGKMVAYRKNIGDTESLWIYDFQTKKEKKLTEFTATVSDGEYSRIDGVVWKEDSKSVAYLVLNRPANDDPRIILKAVIYLNDLSSDSKSIQIPLTGLIRLLLWSENKIFASSGTGEGGDSIIKSINIDDKTIIDRSELLEKNVDKGLATVSGSPDSKKVAVDDSDSTIVIDIGSGKEISNRKVESSSLAGWTNVGDAIYIDYTVDKNGKSKLSIYDFKNKQYKFALFTEDLLRNAYPVTGFSDLSAVVAAKLDFDLNIWNYYVLNIDGTKEVKLPLKTNITQGHITTIPVENF